MLIDTSGLFSYLDADDADHQAAVALLDGATRRLTHSYILAELIALCHARRLARRPVLDLVIDIADDPEFEIVWVDEAYHRDAIELLEQRLDKGYSLCDAVSFVLMRSRNETEALTADHHFEQEGFTALLNG